MGNTVLLATWLGVHGLHCTTRYLAGSTWAAAALDELSVLLWTLRGEEGVQQSRGALGGGWDADRGGGGGEGEAGQAGQCWPRVHRAGVWVYSRRDLAYTPMPSPRVSAHSGVCAG